VRFPVLPDGAAEPIFGPRIARQPFSCQRKAVKRQENGTTGTMCRNRVADGFVLDEARGPRYPDGGSLARSSPGRDAVYRGSGPRSLRHAGNRGSGGV